MKARPTIFSPLWIAFATLFAVATCGGRASTWDGDAEVDPLCASRPAECAGMVGSVCNFEDDCDDGVCCLSNDCGRGMCTYLCGRDTDCPLGMGCDDGFCFFSCSRNSDCAPGQECKEDNTICKYD